MVAYYAVIHRKRADREWTVDFAQTRLKADIAIAKATRHGVEVIGPIAFSFPLGDTNLRELLSAVANAVDVYDVLKDHTDWHINWIEGSGELKECYDNDKTGGDDAT